MAHIPWPPIKFLELHYTMTQFLITLFIEVTVKGHEPSYDDSVFSLAGDFVFYIVFS